MNSSAAIKGFAGRNGGMVCTSSNAKRALDWAFEQGERVFFLPDQHLGRNTAVLELGSRLDDCVLYDPHKPGGGLTAEQLREAKMILWRGHCSVHGRFTEAVVDEVRERIPGVNVLVHPECRHEVVQTADYVGSTEYIIRTARRGAGRLGLGGRHRAEPGAPAGQRPPGQADHVPGPDGLLLLDDEPHRPAAPGVGAGGAGGRATWSTRSRSTRTPRTTPGSRWTRCSRCPASAPRGRPD